MLSVVIATHNSERALLPTLAALVSGAAAGIVREVIVADAGSRDATLEVAEVAGCRVLSSNAPRGVRLKDAAGATRGRWLLFLQPGIVPEGGWVGETRRFIEEAELDGRGADRHEVHDLLAGRGQGEQDSHCHPSLNWWVQFDPDRNRSW